MKLWIEIDETKLEAVKAVLEGTAGANEEKKAPVKTKAATKREDPEEEKITVAGDYETMTSKDLYKLCCERGISSQCKKRDKASLIAVLKANEGKDEETGDDVDWGDEDEEEPEKDPYAGKTAKELYNMCKERGLMVKPRQKPEAYVKALKEADAAGDADTEEEDDDDWEL